MKNQSIFLTENRGFHNNFWKKSRSRLIIGRTYQDLSTIIICPTRGLIPSRVVSSWINLIRPMNQKIFGPVFAEGMEVGNAYNQLFEMILNNKELSKWRYILTIEEDNIPPPDGLLKLYESIADYDVVGGLYWTKGEGGQPMIYGDPKTIPFNFIPQLPRHDTIQECRGLGMGFNLFRTSIFKDSKLQKPWFKTEQSYIEGIGSKVYTQDLYFFENAGKLGYRFACDTRVKVGHYDYAQDTIW